MDWEKPFLVFQDWLIEAEKSELNDPSAMTLATVNSMGIPSARMVLLKGVDERGFVFYTNIESRKGVEIRQARVAALVFHWKSLRRQVQINGKVELVENEEADAYFASRPRGSQIAAWASDQSRPLETSFELEKRVAQYSAKFGIKKIKRPPFWAGFRVIPQEIEFWEDRRFRLHKRTLYKTDGTGTWHITKLFP